MTGNELKKAMTRIGMTCRQLATLCGWANDSRIVEARARGGSEIPEVIDMAIEKFLGAKRYQKLTDTLTDVPWQKVERAKERVTYGEGVEIPQTYRRMLQVVAAKFGVRVEVFRNEKS